MSTFERVPVVDVHTDNFKEIWPSLILAMSSSAFIAIDTELSGLGQRKLLNAKSIEDRFRNISDTAKSRSILSLGISCFKLLSTPQISVNQPLDKSVCQSDITDQSYDSCDINQSGDSIGSQSKCSYLVQTFNILVLCDEDYVVEPASLRFLVQHGFDFNRQYEKGVSYYRGNDKPSDLSIQSIRHLFTELIRMKVPVIVHNGLVDLIFLYQNLYCNLPTSSTSFIADLVDLFPSGIVDTKYVTDFEHLMQASYLEYVYRKCQRDNSQNPLGCDITFPQYPTAYSHVTYRECALKPANDFSHLEDPRALTCDTYAGHGWCTKGKYCPKSHDLDLIIDIDEFTKDRKSRKRKRRKQKQLLKGSSGVNNGADNRADDGADSDGALDMSVGSAADSVENGMEIEEKIEPKQKSVQNGVVDSSKVHVGMKDDTSLCRNCGKSTNLLASSGGHRAGYDAFMTGFIYAVYLTQLSGGDRERKIADWKNKLYLSGKDYPLSVSKSSFSKQSKEHLEKIAKIRTNRP